MTEPVGQSPETEAGRNLLVEASSNGSHVRHTREAIRDIEIEAGRKASWAIEYAIERLMDSDIFPQGAGYVVTDIADVLHEALVGGDPGLTAVGTVCPICGAKRDPRQTTEPHR